MFTFTGQFNALSDFFCPALIDSDYLKEKGNLIDSDK